MRISHIFFKVLSKANYPTKMSINKLRLIDIASNLTDPMYSGIYNGSKKHDPDLDIVLQRAYDVGVEKVIVTAGNLGDVKEAVELVTDNDKLFTTLGVHPTRCSEFIEDPTNYIDLLKEQFNKNKQKIVTLGELGLDYDRTQFCHKETQKKYFKFQLEELGPHLNLPLFLHCRNAAEDLREILSETDSLKYGGVVHSFDGTKDEMEDFVKLGLHIGVNGCSLKTPDNLEVVKNIPLDKLLLETDAPWCSIRPSHASYPLIKTKFQVAKKNYDKNMMYKARNEPGGLITILEVVASLKEMETMTLAERVFENTERLFFS